MGKGGKPKNWPPPFYRGKTDENGRLVMCVRGNRIEIGVLSPVRVKVDFNGENPAEEARQKTEAALIELTKKLPEN